MRAKKKARAYNSKQQTTEEAILDELIETTLPEKKLWCAVIIRAIQDFKTLDRDNSDHISARKWLYNMRSDSSESIKFALDAVVSDTKLRGSIEKCILKLLNEMGRAPN